MGEPSAYIEPLTKLPDEVERVLIVGHNPGLEASLQQLTSRIESLSTCAIAYLVLPLKNWQELKMDTQGELIQLWLPRDLHKKDKEKPSK